MRQFVKKGECFPVVRIGTVEKDYGKRVVMDGQPAEHGVIYSGRLKNEESVGFKEPSPLIERLLSTLAFRHEVISKAQQSAHLVRPSFKVSSIDVPDERRRLFGTLQF